MIPPSLGLRLPAAVHMMKCGNGRERRHGQHHTKDCSRVVHYGPRHVTATNAAELSATISMTYLM